MKKYLIIICFTLFAYNTSAQTKIVAKDASQHIGETVTISDSVSSTKFIASSNMVLLNVGGRYPNQLLTIMIPGTDSRSLRSNRKNSTRIKRFV